MGPEVAILENFARSKKGIDLWGGVRDKQTRVTRERNAMVVIHSATKGLAALTLAIAHSRDFKCRLGREP